MTTGRSMRDRLARLRTGVALALLGGSLGLHALVVLSFVFRWDKAALVTVVPFFGWCLLGVLLAGLSALFRPTLLFRVLALVWLATLLLGADERHGLLYFHRAAPRPDHVPNNTLRLATLNSHYGGEAGLAVVARWQPDIVFLQEPPAGRLLQDLARRMYGPQALLVLRHGCAILARGSAFHAIDCQSRFLPAGAMNRVAMGRLTLADGRQFDLLNLHLPSAERDTAFWTRSCWRAHARNRRERRLLLQYDLSVQTSAMAGWPPAPSIVAGDFNAPASDGAIRGLAATHLDSYLSAGSGLGNTYPAAFPLHRIDQAWLSPELVAVGQTTVPVPGSDHRMVVVDFAVR